MSKTLFWYVLRDLLKIFLLTSGVLAGIMSFGGLLRPMMEYGLSGAQVAQMLTYFMPATQTYSLPIAALFATTLVYGRLAADNELTACRASGISLITMAVPAFVLGLVLAILALVFLSFVVPKFTLKIEKVAFSSLAEVVQKNIERNHQLKLQGYVIYARSAAILPPDPNRPGVETVQLEAPMFCLYKRDPVPAAAEDKHKDRDPEKRADRLARPSEFFMARSATVELRQRDDGVEFQVALDNGTTFPREFTGGAMGGVAASAIPPVLVDSPIKENTKFMDIAQLKELWHDPTRSREINRLYDAITRQEQENAFLDRLARQLDENKPLSFSSDGKTYRLEVQRRSGVYRRPGRIDIAPRGEAPPPHAAVLHEGDTTVFRARQVSLRASVSPDGDRIYLEALMQHVQMDGPVTAVRERLPRTVVLPMPEDLKAIANRGPMHYVKLAAGNPDARGLGEEVRRLARKLPGLRNGIEAEIHARVAFSISCLFLVVLGCSLGMMFRTGNYLSAFALSAIPALLTIALITTGQHVAENESVNSLRLGLALIWSGNLAVLAIAVVLLRHLRRQ